jgi:hypothetical protein
MCFSLQWVENLLIWLVVICAVIAILRVLVAFVLPQLGLAGEVFSVVARIITIVIWAIVIIAVIVFAFSLIECLGPMPRMH